jgi:predicted signal transduction protein with EAL and GGDEF domain
MYNPRSDRKSAMDFVDQDMDRRVGERQTLEQELQTALANNDIRPYFQPLVDLKTKQVSGFEALACFVGGSLPLALHPDRRGSGPYKRIDGSIAVCRHQGGDDMAQ